MVAAAVIVRVTGMLTAVPPDGVILMLPVYVPAPSVLEFTMIDRRLNGVVPLLALAESQLPPLVVVGVTVKEMPAEPEALVTLRVWFVGLDPCSVVKVSEVGVTLTVPPQRHADGLSGAVGVEINSGGIGPGQQTSRIGGHQEIPRRGAGGRAQRQPARATVVADACRERGGGGGAHRQCRGTGRGYATCRSERNRALREAERRA